MTDDKPGRRRTLLPWRRMRKPPWRRMPKPPEDESEYDELNLEQTLEWTELEDQFYWYDRRANGNRNAYWLLKILTLLLGGAVTVLAALSSPAALTASLAAAIVAAEGIQQLFKLQLVWLAYQRTANQLRRIAMSYLMQEKPCDDPDTKTRLTQLAHATQGLLSKQASDWEHLRRGQDGDSGP